MNSPQEIRELSNIRLQEAQALFAAGFYNGACYMAGYSVEIALKAVICKTLDIDDFFCPNRKIRPDLMRCFKTHNLDDLLTLSGLWTKCETFQFEEPEFQKQVSFLKSNWSEQLRYEPANKRTHNDAQKLLDAIQNPKTGILQWIRNFW